MLRARKDYKALQDPTKNINYPHVYVADRRLERSSGADLIHAGERVAFYMIDPVAEPIRSKAQKKSIIAKGEIKTWQRAEDPAYGKEHFTPYDAEYYIQRQLLKPITEMMTWFLYSDLIIKPDDDDFDDSSLTQLNDNKKNKKTYASYCLEMKSKKVRYTYDEAFKLTKQLLFGNIKKRKAVRSFIDEKAELEVKRQKINKNTTSNILLYVNPIKNIAVAGMQGTAVPANNTTIIQPTLETEHLQDLEIIKKRKLEKRLAKRAISNKKRQRKKSTS